MKAIVGYLCVSLALVFVGAACLGAALLDRTMARAQQGEMALKYDEADRNFATAERYFEYESHLPWIGDGPVNDVRARRAAIRYWQRQYAAIISQQPDSGSGGVANNIGLQLVDANAVYRAGQAQTKDRQAMLQALESGIQANLAILKNTDRQEDAAYNYEYLARVHEEILDGRPDFQVTKAPSNSNGVVGTLMEGGDSTKFKTIIPLSIEERKKDGSAGKIPPIKRKG